MNESPSQSGVSRTNRLSAWVVSIGIGALLVLAAGLKVMAPTSFVAVIAYLMPRGVDERLFRIVAACVVAWEVLLGAALICGIHTRRASLAAMGTMAVFSAALLYLASRSDAPGCSCFGPLGIARRAGIDVWFGLARNVAILIALAWLWRGGESRVGPIGGQRGRRGRSRGPGLDEPPAGARGFTLVELLCVIAVVCLVLSFTIPALRSARREAMLTAGLSTQRQLLAGLSLYALDHDAQLPFLARRGDPLSGLGSSEGAGRLEWDGFFRDQSRHWHTLVNPGYVGLPTEALAIPASLGAIEAFGSGPEPVLWGVRYHLTHTAFAAPALWHEPLLDSPTLDASLLRGMRLSDVNAPAQKGLLIDVAMGWHNPDGDPLGGPHMPVGWGDGSTSLLDLRKPDEGRYVHDAPLGANPMPVWSTVSGFEGRDRD